MLVNLNFWEGLTPFGIFTSSSTVCPSITPFPAQVPQGSLTKCPAPSQRSHAFLRPKFVSLNPRPPHSAQTLGELPGSALVPFQLWHTVFLVTSNL